MRRRCPLRARQSRSPELLSCNTPRCPERLLGVEDPVTRHETDLCSIISIELRIMPAESDAAAEQGRPRASEFVFARLRYDSGDWDYNPKVAANLLNSIVEYTSIPVFPEEVVIGASADDLMAFPFLFMTGHKLV